VYRSQLQHVILEIGRRFDLSDFHIVGSAAILAALPNPPDGALTATRDVDVIPPQDDERMADRISFVLGEASDFDLEHGYYVQGVTSCSASWVPDARRTSISREVLRNSGCCSARNSCAGSRTSRAPKRTAD
jgi:hypothetical protein